MALRYIVMSVYALIAIVVLPLAGLLVFELAIRRIRLARKRAYHRKLRARYPSE
jgi:hypothetical protein